MGIACSSVLPILKSLSDSKPLEGRTVSDTAAENGVAVSSAALAAKFQGAQRAPFWY